MEGVNFEVQARFELRLRSLEAAARVVCRFAESRSIYKHADVMHTHLRNGPIESPRTLNPKKPRNPNP